MLYYILHNFSYFISYEQVYIGIDINLFVHLLEYTLGMFMYAYCVQMIIIYVCSVYYVYVCVHPCMQGEVLVNLGDFHI